MTQFFYCPYLENDIELTDKRGQHIIQVHPGTLPEYLEQLSLAIADPDQIRQSERDENALLFSKWFDTIQTGRHFVVVTVTDASSARHWIVTAYTARKLTGGQVIWKKS
ncbi:MAG: hypothetical protein KME12_13695 [Trichocoleus desertorum ATA4-8-CV12]|jgi:hypothetical protein|nr:hypothetical protein [Trichocoleus desertorum ATA4-8-CV12]